MLFTEYPFLERIDKVKEWGFNGIDFWYWKDKDLEAIKKRCDKNSLEISIFTGVLMNQMVDPEDNKRCVDEFKESLKAARSLDCRNMVLHVNTIMEDLSAKLVSSTVSDHSKKENIISIIKQVLPLAESSDIVLCFEPLNTIVDHKGYFLDNSKDAFDIIKEVNSNNLKLLYDIYHMHIMGDEIIPTLEENRELIGYIHVADVPGRHEPGSGEIDFPDIHDRLKAIGYEGYLGFEYMPLRSTEDSLMLTKKVFKF